jgi:hypothetical protein
MIQTALLCLFLCVCVFVLFVSLLVLTLQLEFGLLNKHVNKLIKNFIQLLLYYSLRK